jgi:hypothetical protein
VLAGCLPAIGVAVDWIRWRTLEVVAAVVLGGIALSIVLAVVSDDPKVILLEGAAITATFGLACFASLFARRPMIFFFAQAFSGGRHSAEGAEFDSDYDTYADARFFWRTVTVVWGVVDIAQAAALAYIVHTSSTGTALTYNRTVPWVVTALLFGWTFWWGERLRAQKPADAD